MFDYVEGEIAARTPARLVIDVHGVGYDLVVPLSATFAASGRVRAWTHLVVREDAHTLYGFPDRAMRELFRVLLSVRGVGPVVALALLSGLAREDLLDAIANGDSKALTRAKGVGKKTGEQILLDLREKAVKLRADLGSRTAAGVLVPHAGAARGAHVDDAVGALVSIGYSEKEARRNVERAAETVGARDLEALVRAALAG